MLEFKNLRDAKLATIALGSEIRLEILSLLAANKSLNLDALARTLHISNSALTSHIKKLQEAGLIVISKTAGKHGTSKSCCLAHDKLLFNICDQERTSLLYQSSLNVGQYDSAKIYPPCALFDNLGRTQLQDDPRAFVSAFRFDASMLWTNGGEISYKFASLLQPHQKLEELCIFFEASAKGIGSLHADTPISVFVNDNLLHAISFSEYHDRRGVFSPKDWQQNYPQYGKGKAISLTHEGCFFEGRKVSEFCLSDLDTTNITLTLSAASGFCLFGQDFGDYKNGITLYFYGQNASIN